MPLSDIWNSLFGKKQNQSAPEMKPSGAVLPTRIGDLSIMLLSSADAERQWHRSVAAFPTTGKWPLIVGPQSNFHRLEAMRDLIEEGGPTPADIIEASATVDVPSLLQSRAESLLEEEELDALHEVDISTFNPKARSETRPCITYLPQETKTNELFGYVEIPCAAPYEVYSVLAFGDWNDVPTDAELIAFLKLWNQRFGVLPFAATSDEMELYLPQVIKDPQVAAELYRDFIAFCPDMIDTPAGAELAFNRNFWYFWWD